MTLAAREAEALIGTYRRFPVTFVRGEGTLLFDDTGRPYLDFAAGIAVAQIGHAHPRWVRAVAGQASELAHVSNLFFTEPQVALAERLRGLLGWGRAFFANSGAEANEAALKLARRATGRHGVVAALGGFHGRTLATLAATGYPEKHAPFAPLPEWFAHVPYGDPAALAEAVGPETGAVLLEPVLGEGGVVPAPTGYLRAAREVCDAAGALLVLDEVQTGIGRCGAWLAGAAARPDIVTLAKGLGGGLPVGACLATDEVASAFEPGDHASTFGGGPVVCAGALAVLDVIEEQDLLANAREQGARLLAGLEKVAVDAPVAIEARGLGLLVGLELDPSVPARQVVEGALARGLVVTEAGRNTVRLTPPLTVSAGEADEAVAILAEVLA